MNIQYIVRVLVETCLDFNFQVHFFGSWYSIFLFAYCFYLGGEYIQRSYASYVACRSCSGEGAGFVCVCMNVLIAHSVCLVLWIDCG